MKGAIPLVFLALIISISGCTIPGTNYIIPFPGFDVTSFENDVIIISSLQAIPSEVSATQQVRLLASIVNQGSKEFSDETQTGINTGTRGDIEVTLYDYCSPLFKLVKKCGTDLNPSNGDCSVQTLYPKETKQVEWILDANPDIKLPTSCDFKVSVSYPYKTNGLTTIHFINSKEMQRQIEDGSFQTKNSEIVLGEGPIKAWFDIRDQQPIPTDSGSPSYIPVLLKLENKGGGFLASKINIPKPDTSDLKINESACEFKEGMNDVELIQGEKSLYCEIENIKDADVSKETKKQLIVEIEYDYEFRSQTKVNVEPSITS
jgi:hypothetical protein